MFVFRKMAAILNFQIFGKTTKLLISPKWCKIERFRRNFQPPGYLSKILGPNFKMVAILNFRIFGKNTKLLKFKMATILNFRIFGKNTKLLISPKQWEIERFRRNFQPQAYLRKILYPNFKKNFVFWKMAAILNFRIFGKNTKLLISP